MFQSEIVTHKSIIMLAPKQKLQKPLDLLECLLEPSCRNIGVDYTLGTTKACLQTVLQKQEMLDDFVPRIWHQLFLVGNVTYMIGLFLLILPGNKSLVDLCMTTARCPKRTLTYISELIPVVNIFIDGLNFQGGRCSTFDEVAFPTISCFVDFCRDKWVTN